MTKGGLPPLVRSCVGCIVARASISNPENDALLGILADLSPVIFLSITVFELDGIALHLKTGSGKQIEVMVRLTDPKLWPNRSMGAGSKHIKTSYPQLPGYNGLTSVIAATSKPSGESCTRGDANRLLACSAQLC